ncbi:citrate synthase/methylcitrate synthase [Erythrobacter mangrovi]|uniref:citrate synthase (unknown stereospecificity) n=1 Tax=Erythrobacter mangrovi TaxID=2739433 RepID=A0A7D4AT59_9SPHN|nr:citrate synthase/methylcitrate synthase [Erythrobacter mangrovi]QKG70717.1 citrate synthase/methylcitrate synthase [Erythrobacter mangrovi]
MASGLEGVVAAETVLSDVRGEVGELVIRGYRLDELAGRRSFEQVAHLLFAGFFDNLPDEQVFAARLGSTRAELFDAIHPALPGLAQLPPYDGVRALVAGLADTSGLDDAFRLLALPAVALPALVRQRDGLDPIFPDPTLGHAADVVRMLGRDAGAGALDAYLATVSDHGLNASTFAARVVASTQAGLTSAVLAGYSALKGPLHGGAPGPVIDMLDAIAEEGDAAAWISRAFDRGDRLMGFGHRIYRTRDPRADVLKAQVAKLAGSSERLAFAEQVEQVALAELRRRKPDRVLDTNVEFYTALLLEAVGFPKDCFTAVFAMGRTAGWLAHAREQAMTGRVIRPASRYIEPPRQQAA